MADYCDSHLFIPLKEEHHLFHLFDQSGERGSVVG
jgi:hypothetical protein